MVLQSSPAIASVWLPSGHPLPRSRLISPPHTGEGAQPSKCSERTAEIPEGEPSLPTKRQKQHRADHGKPPCSPLIHIPCLPLSSLLTLMHAALLSQTISITVSAHALFLTEEQNLFSPSFPLLFSHIPLFLCDLFLSLVLSSTPQRPAGSVTKMWEVPNNSFSKNTQARS